MRSDNELNFAGANRELKREIEIKVARQALVRGMKWGFNPPGAVHFGGAWERLIRSVQKILNALLISQTLSEEKLRTLLCEVKCIARWSVFINNRPLTPVSARHRDLVPLTTDHRRPVNQ